MDWLSELPDGAQNRVTGVGRKASQEGVRHAGLRLQILGSRRLKIGHLTGAGATWADTPRHLIRVALCHCVREQAAHLTFGCCLPFWCGVLKEAENHAWGEAYPW